MSDKGFGGTILHTTDRGNTWIQQQSGLTQNLKSIMFVDTLYGWAVGEKGTILKTEDGGHFWRLIPQIPGTEYDHFNDIFFDNHNNGWLVGGKAGGALGNFIYYSNNGGETWQLQLHSVSNPRFESVYFVNSNKGFTVGGVEPWMGGLCFSTIDGGNNWNFRFTVDGRNLYYLDIYFSNEQDGWICGVESDDSGWYIFKLVLKTADGGNSWVRASPDPYYSSSGPAWDNLLYGINFFDSQRGWTVGSKGAVFFTENAGQTWIGQTSPTQANLSQIFFTDQNNGWAVGDYAVIVHTSDGGYSWELQENGLNNQGSLWGIFFTDSLNGWVSGEIGKILHTSDGGNYWETQNSGTNVFLNNIYFLNSQEGWIVGEQGLIKHTTSGGSGYSWQIQNSGVIYDLHGVYFVDSQNGWVVGESGIILNSINGGHNWNTQNSGTGQVLHDVFFIDYQHGWVVGNYGKIIKTIDGGTTWSSVSSSTNKELWDIHFINSQRGWIVGDEGTILSTEDGGSSWQTENSGVPNYLSGVSAVEGDVWAVGGDAIILHNNYATVSVENPKPPIISNYELLQNYPNPFNPSTKIRFTISDVRFTSLKVYDILGNDVATLVNEVKPIGNYNVEFEATGFPSGIYFYQLKAGSFIETKKMILLK